MVTNQIGLDFCTILIHFFLKASYCDVYQPCRDVTAKCIDTFGDGSQPLPYLCLCPQKTLGYPDCTKNVTDYIMAETKSSQLVANPVNTYKSKIN